MFGRVIFLLLLITQSLFSIENDEDNPASPLKHISDSAGGPSTLIDSVSIISGLYCETEADVTVMAPVPLTIERSKYNGESTHSYQGDWKDNYVYYLSLEESHEKSHHKKLIGKLGASHGSELSYYTRQTKDHQHILKLDEVQYNFSVTNCSGGDIGGRTNMKNTKIVVHDKLNCCEVIAGDNTKTLFKFDKKYKNVQFVRETFPNLNYIERSDKFILLKNRNGKQLAWKTEECFPINGSLSRKVVHVSDGRAVYYTYEDIVDTHRVKDEEGYKKNVSKTFTLLKDVVRPDGPPIHFKHYKDKDNKIDPRLLKKRELPEGRYVGFEYYIRKATNDVFNIPKVKISSGEDMRFKRIRRLTAPLGTDNAPHPKYQFLYEKQKHNNDAKKGTTTVWDALGRKTVYHNETRRITSIEKYAGDALYSEEVYTWDLSKTDKKGNLNHYAFKTGTGQVLFEKNYTYDDNHNIIQSELKGNLIGEGSYDSRVKLTSFTKDDRNLPLTIYDGEKLFELSYYEGTDLTRSKIQTGGDGLRKRMFYEYDDSAVMTLEMVDDGLGNERNDLTGVTERRIRRIIPSDIGVPLEVTDAYLDEMGTEVVIRREKNAYNKLGRLLRQEIYDGLNNFLCAFEWDYDSMGNVTREMDAEGFNTHRHYDPNGNLIFEQRDSESFYKLWHYDFMNRVIASEEVHPDVKLTSRYAYDLCGNKISEADYYGNTTFYVYDCFNREIERRIPPFATTCNNQYVAINRKEYDHYGYVSADINPLGGRTVYTNNLNGQCTKIVYPDGSVERCDLDIFGRVIRKVDKAGCNRIFHYDSLGRVTYEEFDGIAVKKAHYNAFHKLSETDPSGLETFFEYDRSGKKVREICGSEITHFEYDTFGRLFRITNSTESRETDYDAKVRVIEERAFDLNGRLLTKIGYRYDLSGRKTHTFTYTDSGVLVDEKRYNSHGDIVSHKNAMNEETITSFHYEFFNEFGQRVGRHEMVDPVGQKLVTILDTLGRVANVELYNPHGQICQKRVYRYDALGNRLQSAEHVYQNDKLEKTIINQWHWDGMSRLLVVIEAVGTPEQKATRTSYDIRGLKTLLTKPDGQQVAYTYDKWGRVSSMKGGDIAYEYTYDVMSRPIEIRDMTKGTISTKKFDREHRLIEEKLGNDLSLAFGWDGRGRITDLTLPDNGSVKVNYSGALLESIVRLDNRGIERYRSTYDKYDLSGKVLEMTLPGNVKLTRSYDNLLRPKSLVTSEWSQHLDAYNGAGGLTGYTINDLEGTYDRQFTYDDLYQLSSEKGEFDHHYKHDSLYNLVDKDGENCRFNSLNQPLDYSQEYDRNGNLVKDKERTYRYDILDRLIEVTYQGSSTHYSYDADNRRLTSNNKKYLYQGQDEIGMVENGTLRHFRLLGSGLGAEISASVALELDGEVFAPIHDHNGNISALYDATGSLVTCYRYSAFGESRHIGTQESPWKHSSKRWDEESELYYFGRRYYNPVTHRWISADPIKFDGGANLYAYVLNNPLTQIDCYGLYAGYDNLTQNQYIQTFCNTLKNYAPVFGEIVEFIGFNFIPIPLVRDVVEFTGHALSGKALDAYVPSYRREHTTYGCVQGQNNIIGQIFFMLNGICTSEREMRERAQAKSDELGGATVHYVYNGTKGIVTDLIESALQKAGIMTPPDLMAKQHITRVMDESGVPLSKVNLMLEAHSQGGIIAGNLANNLQPEYTKQIHVRTIGSACMVDDKRFASCLNYVSTSDPVPLTDTYGYLKGRFTENSKVKFMKPESFVFCDHFYGGNTYTIARNEINKEFIRDFLGKK